MYKPQYRELALDLFKYNFYVNGFGFGATSFIHLAPAALKIELPNFTSNLNKLMSNEENDRFSASQLDIFIDQFYRNHLGSRKLVPETKSIKSSEITDENGKVFDSLDLRITRKTHPDLYSSNGTLLTYFAVDVNGNKEYFKVTDQVPDVDNKIITTIENVQPVGIRNNFLEFDFNNINIETKIASGKVNDRSEYEAQYQDASMSQEGYNYEYNPESANQEMSEEMAEHYRNAFNYIQEENTKFKPLHEQSFEALSEEDMPAYTRDNYNQTENNNMNNNIKYYSGNITNDGNTIFVFGSNPEGRHGAGAAKIAREQFGAIYGQGEGLQGDSYALPTKDLRVKTNNGYKSITPETIINSIKVLYNVARNNTSKQFKIAYRNTTTTSLNGYTGIEMINMFNQVGPIPNNIVFSKEWFDTGLLNNSLLGISKEDIEEAKNKCK